VTNPPITRFLTGSVPSTSAMAVVNAFYDPFLCGYTVAWTAPNLLDRSHGPLPRSVIEIMLDSVSLEDFDGRQVEIPR
jgi:hypothetical protein